jgi:ATP-dependent DNA helicase RecG
MISDLAKDGAILQRAREAAIDVLNQDPELEKPDNKVIRTQIESMRKTVVNWSRIS